MAAAAMVKRQVNSQGEVEVTLTNGVVVAVTFGADGSGVTLSQAVSVSTVSTTTTGPPPTTVVPPPTTVVPPPTTVVPPPTTVVPPPTTVIPPPTTVIPPPTTVIIPPTTVVIPPTTVVPPPVTTIEPPLSTVSVQAANFEDEEVPLLKRQVVGDTYQVTLGSNICSAVSPYTFTFTPAAPVFKFAPPFCQVLSVRVAEFDINGAPVTGGTGCTDVNETSTTGACAAFISTVTSTTFDPTTITSSTTATETTTSVTTSITTTTSTTTVIGNPTCGCFDHIFTYWFYTAYICTSAQINVPFIFCGLVQVCKTVGQCYFPTTYILTGNQVQTVTLINGYTAPYVPLIVTTINNNVVTVPASTVQTYATVPASVVSQYAVQTQNAVAPPPVVTAYTGAASKAGLGALAAIAGAAALL